ncbi:MAG: iron-sulfur cluster assembly scaffold protein [Alphaproteobacteria bacterium]|jgi:nitrogen fixation protein NifU and related proteins|nr:iron-sulfur cluster assembly scaffold protein [Alphaproteobacteria bacterium]
MNDALYHKAVMRMAATSKGAGGLENPGATATVDNPLCGDRVTMDVTLADGVITEVGHKVRGCVLCQASASTIGEHAVGQRAEDVKRVQGRILGMLNGAVDKTPEPWTEDVSAFEPVTPHKSRHKCVLLPFDALVEALDNA